MFGAMHAGFAKAGACMALFVFGTAAFANPVTDGVAEIEFGYMCQVASDEEMIAEDTISGTVSIVSGTPEFRRLGTTVPAQIGIEFGVKARALPEFEGPVTIHVAHPPHGAAGITHESWQSFLAADEMGYASFAFELPYEVTPGEWTISAVSDGRLVFSVTFDVVAPVGSPIDELGCDGPALVS